MPTHWTPGCEPAAPPSNRTGRLLLTCTTVAELVARAGIVLREQTYGGSLDHVVMIDPDGNEFCVA